MKGDDLSSFVLFQYLAFWLQATNVGKVPKTYTSTSMQGYEKSKSAGRGSTWNTKRATWSQYLGIRRILVIGLQNYHLLINPQLEKRAHPPDTSLHFFSFCCCWFLNLFHAFKPIKLLFAFIGEPVLFI